MLEHQARIVRAWAAVCAFVLLGLWEPALWFGLVPIGVMATSGCCCENCECVICQDNKQPCDLEVELVSISNGTCGSCTTLNAVYVLTPNAGRVPAYPEECIWVYLLPSAICTIVALTARFSLDGALDYRLSIELATGTNPIVTPWVFFKIFGSSNAPQFDPPPDCMAWSAVSTTGQAGIGAFGCVRTTAYAVFSAA